MKTQFVICIAVYVMTACLPLMAQENEIGLKDKYEREALMLDGTRDEYIKNNETKRIGVFKPKIEQEFSFCSSETKEEITSFRKRRRRGSALLIAGGAVFVTAAVVAPVITVPVFLATFGTGMGTYYVGAFDLNRSRRHLNKAVWLHNRDVIAKN